MVTNAEKIKRIEVYNTIGVRLNIPAIRLANSNKYVFDLTGKSSGLYFIKIEIDDASIIKRFVLK